MLAALLLASALSGAYRVNPAQAEAGFELKATLHTVHGHTTRVTGEVKAADGPDGSLALSGAIEVNAAALETGNSSRDQTMHEKTLAVEQYPVLRFAPERFVPSGPPDASGAISGTIAGTLTIRAVSKPATLKARLTPQAPRLLVEGTFDVPWPEFGAPDPSFAFVRVEKVAHARFRAELVPIAP